MATHSPVASPPLSGPTPTSGSGPAGPDPEVGVKKPRRRRFPAAYKLRILKTAEQCGPGEIGALLRREGLYSSHLTTWRREREGGELEGLASKARGRKSEPQADELARLQRENEALQARLTQAEAIIDVQKKLSQLFGLTPPPAPRARS